MNKNILKLYQFLITLETALIPNYFLIRTNPDFLSLRQFMELSSKKIKPSDKILDAGAGLSPYKKYFSHAKYESTDIKDFLDRDLKKIHTFLCSIDNIPKPNNYYDAILNTQVLEHVEYPQKVINEFYRILKPGGKLFLTAPQGWGLHEEPYNFYNFTSYGLRSLFKNAGFKIIFIKPKGGIFWYIGSLLRTLPSYLYFQFIMGKSKNNQVIRPNILTALLLFPIFFASKIFLSFIIPLIFYYLDPLDKNQIFTLGYNCYCVKPKN